MDTNYLKIKNVSTFHSIGKSSNFFLLLTARLPFKPVASPNQLKLPSTPSPQLTKKKKQSNTPSPFFTSNGKGKHAEKRTTPSKKADTPQSKKHAGMKGKKIGFANDDTTKSAKSGQGASFVAETEVSSSSEEFKPSEKGCDSTVGNGLDCDSSVPVKKTPKAASMDCFVQTTQQPQVSTSDIVDLTDADDEMEDEEEEDAEQPNSSSNKSREVGQGESPSEKSKEEEGNGEKPEDTTGANTSMSTISSLEDLSSDEESSDEEANNSDDESVGEKHPDDATCRETATNDGKCNIDDTAATSSKEEGKEVNKIPGLPSGPGKVLEPTKKVFINFKVLLPSIKPGHKIQT